MRSPTTVSSVIFVDVGRTRRNGTLVVSRQKNAKKTDRVIDEILARRARGAPCAGSECRGLDLRLVFGGERGRSAGREIADPLEAPRRSDPRPGPVVRDT